MGDPWSKRNQALNHPVQGSCADGLKQALVLLRQRRQAECPGGQIVATVHDEVIVTASAE